MTIPRNLSFLAEGASSTGVLGTANGGTGLNTLGTAGQALVVNSGATGLTYSTPSAGAITLISTQTASSSASLQWTGLSGYDKYIIVFENVIPATNNVILYLQFGTGSTPTYITSNYQNLSVYGYASGSTAQTSTNQNSSQIYVTNVNGVNNTGYGVCGFMNIEGFISTTNYTSTTNNLVWGGTVASALTDFVQSGGAYLGATSTAKTAIKIYFSSGNITSGTASLYGISS